MTRSLGASGNNSNDAVFRMAGEYTARRLDVQTPRPLAVSSASDNDVKVAADLNLNFDRIQPFIGGNVGYVSGPGTHTAEAAPEGGVKIFLTNQAFLYGMIEYNFFWHATN